jgi:transposase
MPQNFIGCGREQAFLMPPSLREWLPEDHLAWFIVDAVEDVDLEAFYADYRADGHGAAAYEPSMMVALVLYAYATKQRSSRAIECHCRQDVAYRVIAANRVPDHATIARFIVRHEAALGELFGSVLALCAKAGLVKTGVVAIDGTKIAANASREANLDYERIAREIVAEAVRIDEAEDELYGEARGDELPEELRTREGRRRWLSEAKRELEQGEDPAQDGAEPAEDPPAKPRGRAINRVAAAGTARPATSSTSAAPARRSRSRARARRAWLSQLADSRRSSRPSARRTRPTRTTEHGQGCATDGASAPRRSPTRCPRSRPGRSTRPTPTHA